MDKKVLRNLSYGMYVIGAKNEKNVGMIANTVVQITSDPMTVAVSINHNNYTNQVIKETKKFSISILDEEVNPEVIGVFGYQTSREVDKFSKFDMKEILGVPVLTNTCGVMICNVIDIMETSTHTLFLGEVVAMEDYSEKTPMTYRYYHEVLKGKSPKNAPTFVKEEEPQNKTVWKCSVCGYEVEMYELPDDYRCPICGQPKSAFIKKEDL